MKEEDKKINKKNRLILLVVLTGAIIFVAIFMCYAWIVDLNIWIYAIINLALLISCISLCFKQGLFKKKETLNG